MGLTKGPSQGDNPFMVDISMSNDLSHAFTNPAKPPIDEMDDIVITAIRNRLVPY